MRTLKYVLFIAVALAMLRYHANIAYLLGIGGRVVPAATALDRYRDEARKSVVVYRMGEIEGKMAALHKTATDSTLPIEQRETALVELEKLKGRAEDVTGVTAARKAVRGALGGILKSSGDPRKIQPIGWNQSPASVQAGDNVEIIFNPGSMWTYWPGNPFGTVGPEGNCQDISQKTGGFCAGQALIRFGNGRVQGWTNGKVVADVSGPIFIGMADSGLSDNQGYLVLSDVIVNGQSVFSQTAKK